MFRKTCKNKDVHYNNTLNGTLRSMKRYFFQLYDFRRSKYLLSTYESRKRHYRNYLNKIDRQTSNRRNHRN